MAGRRASRDLAADGITIFLTTQYLDEADELADRIAVLDQGKLVAEGTPGEREAAAAAGAAGFCGGTTAAAGHGAGPGVVR